MFSSKGFNKTISVEIIRIG
jgi:hypothetical protein